MADRTALTDIALKRLTPPPTGQIEVWDAKLPGFGIRITANGTRSFVLVYRHRGKPRRMTLGRYPDLPLADARNVAREALAKVGKGIDPGREGEVSGDTTFAAVVGDFLTLHCARRNRASSAREMERLLKVEFVPRWRNRRVEELRRNDVLGIIDGVMERGTPSAANHAFAAIRKFFNWCVERGLIEASPCVGLKSPAKVKSRDRVLTDDELAAVVVGARSFGYPFGTIVELLALTAQRRGEVAGMRWEHLDLDHKTWSIPAEFNKSGRPHTVPLHDRAVSLLRQLPHLHDSHVFPARGESDNTYVGFNKGKRRLDDRLGFTDWTFHDLRRTAASGMARHKVPPHVVERILNHVTGTLGGVAGVYNRFGYLDEMRAALEMWGDYVANVSDCYRK